MRRGGGGRKFGSKERKADRSERGKVSTMGRK